MKCGLGVPPRALDEYAPLPMGDIEYDEPPTYRIFAGPES